MENKDWPGITTAVLILFILTMIVWLGVAGPIWNAAWTASPDQWLGFAGSVLGALVTLLAAIVAWFAVSRQIRSSAKIARARQIETFQAIKVDLRDLLEWLNEVWRTIDFARQSGLSDIVTNDRYTVVRVTSETQTLVRFEPIERLADDLAPLTRRALYDVTTQLKVVDGQIRAIGLGGTPEHPMDRKINSAWINLSHLHKYLLSLDHDLANIFADRQKANVNHANAAELIRPFVNENLARN